MIAMYKDAALWIIDAQVNMFTEGGSVFEGEKLLCTLSRLAAQARAGHLPILYVQNNGGEADPDLPGTPGCRPKCASMPPAGGRPPFQSAGER